jgi:PAS domain S-box-containing protein
VVTKIVQDNLGFLWLSSADGLRRYDSYGFMRVPESGSSSSTGFIISESLMRDRSGRIWFGADDSLGRYDPATGSIKQYRSDNAQCGTVAIAHQISEDPDGLIWLATDDGITALDPATSKTTCYQPRRNIDPTIGEKRVIATLPSRDGALWITSSAGIYTLDRRSGKVIRYFQLETSSGRKFRCTGFPATPFQDSTGIIWVGLSSGGDLAAIHPGSGEITVYSFEGAGLPPNTSSGVLSIQEDQDGTLWLGTNRLGLVKLTPDRKQAMLYQSDPDDPKELSGDLVLHLFLDREGSFWASTKSGDVYRFEPHAPVFQSYRHQPGNPHSLNNDAVISAYAENRNILWVGTDRGLNRVDRMTRQVTRYEQPLFTRGVRAIAKDRSGNLWFGTRGNGLVRLDPNSGRYRTYSHSASDPRTLSFDNIEALWIDRRGTLWVATDYGLNRFDPATEEFRKYAPQQYSLTQYRSVAEDPGGVMWLATASHGLHRFDPRTEEFTVFENRSPGLQSRGHGRLNSVHVDRSGTVWAASFQGLDKLNPRDGTFTSYDSRSGLPSDTVLGILEDEKGYLWVSTLDGLSRFDPRTGTCTNYHTSDGLTTDLFSVPVVAANGPGGEMFFGSHSGLVAFFPGEVNEKKPVATPVVLTNFRLFGEMVQPGKGPLKEPIWSAASLELTAGSILSFDFSALSYTDPLRTRYRYRLEDLESEWNETDSTRRTATYTTLPAGDYNLRVQARTTRAGWSESGATLHIRILPPWWTTWWFRSAGAVVFLTLAWVVYRLRIRQLQREFNKLQAVIETIPGYVWSALPDGSIDFINKRWLEFSGLSLQQALGWGWTAAVHPDDRAELVEAWTAAFTSGKPMETEARVGRADGQYRWMLIRNVPLHDKKGKIVKWYGKSTDIDDRKSAEEERERLRQVEADLAHINRVNMMGEFAASIAHEVNQPLSGIVSNGSACLRWLAGDTPNLEEAREAVRDIVRDGKRAGEVIARIRALTKRAAMPSEMLDLNEVIREVLVLAGERMKREDVRVQTRFANDLAPVSGDRIQLQQVVLNLVGNAIEAMSGVMNRLRELNITTRNINADQVQVSVEDSGPGLDAAAATRVFEAFYTTKASGMGLGLSISRSILQNHGGRLWATPNSGPGTSFHFTLPKYHGETNAGVAAV